MMELGNYREVQLSLSYLESSEFHLASSYAC